MVSDPSISTFNVAHRDQSERGWLLTLTISAHADPNSAQPVDRAAGLAWINGSMLMRFGGTMTICSAYEIRQLDFERLIMGSAMPRRGV